MIEGVLSIGFYALIGAFLSLVAVASSTRAKANMKLALVIQSVVMIVWGLISSVPAGLTSGAGYPHYLVPVIFLIALFLAHAVWRIARRQEDSSNG
ncbi:MAG TPA: hypothetical protein VML75_27165 [Kofleriaceae bacterium]|nr:hypothetical protein [Kofleriaceae bacterium]